MKDMDDIAVGVDHVLVALWNDLSNRREGQIVFEDSMNIIQARNTLLEMFKKVIESKSDEQEGEKK